MGSSGIGMKTSFPGIRVSLEPERTLPGRVKEALHAWCFHAAAERWMQECTDECMRPTDPKSFAEVASRFVTIEGRTE